MHGTQSCTRRKVTQIKRSELVLSLEDIITLARDLGFLQFEKGTPVTLHIEERGECSHACEPDGSFKLGKQSRIIARVHREVYLDNWHQEESHK